ncbi:hypothetical protein AcV5_003634 [Taiwanofungus camphoratus]|nr:hypothetical protein AcV5_003634 [Antrodia cinnamomea]KAI0958316.1 hypothetical protein AcV7_004168 [Antrodia cinnamomea]
MTLQVENFCKCRPLLESKVTPPFRIIPQASLHWRVLAKPSVGLRPEWNIKVTIIEPGGFSTGTSSYMVRTSSHPAYTSYFGSRYNVRLLLSNPRPGDVQVISSGEAIRSLALFPS